MELDREACFIAISKNMFRLIYPVILRSETRLRCKLRPAGDEASLTMKDTLGMWETLRYAQGDKIDPI